jgi:Putative beta-lactamase-inhibitor-like, PepSY-like
MNSFRSIAFLICLSFITAAGFAQVTSVPEQAKENFAKQYPAATAVKWSNDIVNVNVEFDLDGEHMNAEYNNKGIWKSTRKEWSFDKLTEAVKDGFQKSKYADREVSDVKIIYLPGDVVQYRLKVEKNDLQKKFLYFNEKGRLLRSAIKL